MKCKWCDREFARNCNVVTHEKYYCSKNPDSVKIAPWNKGETKETNESVKKYAEALKGKAPSNGGRASTKEGEELRKIKISDAMKKNPNAGGYREGSGRGKKGWFNGIYCDSSWELAFVYYHMINNIPIIRVSKTDFREYLFEGRIRKYFPDFIVNDTIYEIKGFQTPQSIAKSEQNPDIKVLLLDEIKPYLDFVISKYGSKFWEELYTEGAVQGTNRF